MRPCFRPRARGSVILGFSSEVQKDDADSQAGLGEIPLVRFSRTALEDSCYAEGGLVRAGV